MLGNILRAALGAVGGSLIGVGIGLAFLDYQAWRVRQARVDYILRGEP